MIDVKAAWNRFWFRETPYFDLAFMRIVMVALQCFLMLSMKFNHLQYVIDQPASLFRPLPALKIFMLPWGWGAPPDSTAVIVIFWLTLAVGVLALVGAVTNVSLFLFAVGSIFLQAFLYSFGDSHHPEAVMVIALLAFSLAPCGRVLSIDAWLRERIGEGRPAVALLEYRGSDAHWPIRLIQCFFGLMYLSAVTSKLVLGGLNWANGYTLQYYMVQDYLRRGSELGHLLSQHHYVVMGLQVAALVFQATFFLAVFFPRSRWVYIPLGLGFHLGILLVLGASFPEWIVLYGVFIPWATALRRLADKRTPLVAPLRPTST